MIHLANLSLCLIVLFASHLSLAQNIMTEPTEDAPKCFGRIYEQEYLQQHQEQQVVSITAKVRLFIDVDKTEELFAAGKDEVVLTPAIVVQARNRKSQQIYRLTMECNKDTGICTGYCPGPQIRVRYSTNNPNHILVDVSKFRYAVLSQDHLCQQKEIDDSKRFIDNVWGGDNVFLLKPVDQLFCL